MYLLYSVHDISHFIRTQCSSASRISGFYRILVICCRFADFSLSEDYASATVMENGRYEGGEVIENNQQTAVDVIKNVRKINRPDGRYSLPFSLFSAQKNFGCSPILTVSM